MVYRHRGYLSDSTYDLMDSAMRAGIKTIFSGGPESVENYEDNGILVRGPIQYPASNSRNFTRDQLIPLVAAFYFSGYHATARRVFYSHMRRSFFCQNFERDIEGSTKYPWPHKIKVGDPKDIGSWRVFDFADPLMPHHMFMLALAGRVYWAYFLAPVAYLFLLLSILFVSKDTYSEQNQMQCMLKVYGKPWVSLYKFINPNWERQTDQYWFSRGEFEYAYWIKNAF